jgi:hypothetical protein
MRSREEQFLPDQNVLKTGQGKCRLFFSADNEERVFPEPDGSDQSGGELCAVTVVCVKLCKKVFMVFGGESGMFRHERTRERAQSLFPRLRESVYAAVFNPSASSGKRSSEKRKVGPETARQATMAPLPSKMGAAAEKTPSSRSATLTA